MQTIIQTLSENVQVIYRKSIDADQVISLLQHDGKGKFSDIFAKDAGFSISSRLFKPYVEELASEVLALEKINQDAIKEKLPSLVKKIELMLKTLNKFQKTAR
jgi:ABC-type Zn uptake system ZnuABC Zn-binding protein ZnuA